MSALTSLKLEVKDYAALIGIDKIGFARAKPLKQHLGKLLQRQETASSQIINEGEPLKRINPALHLEDARSVICAAVAYSYEDGLEADRSRGRLSFISRGTDYHVIMKNKLELLKEFIIKRIPDAKILTMVDKEELLEKAFAVEAGLGWFGKNTLLITPEFGSMVFLGELVTNLPFPADSPIAGGCGDCQRCISACPTSAINNSKNLNIDTCLAGVSQYKGLIGSELRELMGNTIYGCDICQVVCPYNRKLNLADRANEKKSCNNFSQEDEHFPILKDLLSMSNAEFKKKFGHTSGAWRGRTVFQRNAAIAAGNAKAEDTVPILIKILKNDGRPVLRATVAWALGRIGHPVGVDALRVTLNNETDLTVLAEIRRSLELFNKNK